MSDQHKAVLQQANAAIQTGDIEGFLVHCTDDIQWTTVGEATIDGKAAVRDWMAGAYAQPPVFDVSDMIAEGDVVVALGTLTTRDDEGRSARHRYSDVWHFRDGKMAALQAFVV